MTARLYKTRTPAGKLDVWQVDETVPVPDKVTSEWLREHATRVAVRLHGPEWSYKDPVTGTWATCERPDLDRLPEVRG